MRSHYIASIISVNNMAEERRLRELYTRKMAEVHRLGELVNRLRDEIISYPEREAVLMPIWVERAREWQRLWAETRAVSVELTALLRQNINEIGQTINYWDQREL